MRKHTAAALLVGVLAVGALGVWLGPSLMDRESEVSAPPAAAASPAAEPATPRRAVAPRTAVRRDVEKTTLAAVPATQPDLQARLKPVLNRGTRMEVAAAGFRDAEQFATVAHAARNTGVPFAVLKHRVLEERQTLARAIRSSKPDLDAQREVARARRAARDDIAAIRG
jgi:hypothetical protein